MEKFSKNLEQNDVLRELSIEERTKMNKTSREFDFAMQLLRKSTFDSANKILENGLEMGKIKDFSKKLLNLSPDLA